MGSLIGRRSLAADNAGLRRALLNWYDRHRRDLPWRADRDPYRVWVAEVMLQQTRIAVVVPAYERFLRAFPTVGHLAAADEGEVLAQWSGLGYYSRARALHGAARLLAAASAPFPRDYAAARALPGVGAYTAAAVLSIAYGEPHAAVDGNVARVLSRLRRLERPNARGEPHASLAAALLDRSRPGDWNQAIMELGETVCTPSPRCPACPVAAWCEARIAGAVDRYPPAAKRRAVEKVATTMLVIRNRRGDLVLERGVFPYLPRMWLPILDGDGAPTSNGAVPVIRHAITHRTFQIRVVARSADNAEIAALVADPKAERRLFSEGDLQRIGRSSLLHKALAVAS